MKMKVLGRTGLKVSEICFGTLPMGPLQLNMPVPEGAALIRKALEEGINFIDTAEAYKTNQHIAEALKDYTGEVIIATKSMATGFEDMEKSILKASEELGRPYLDIFFLHAARADKNIFEERAGALKCLVEYKAKGMIRFIGVSTHSVEAVHAAIDREEIDVIFPIINLAGMGIIHGNLQDMLAAIERAHQAGKGLIAMKALGGGNLIDKVDEAINYVRNIEGMSSIAVGMVNQDELDVNLKIFRDQPIPEEVKIKNKSNKKLFISRLCIGCGSCVKACPNFALELKDNKAVVDHEKCLLCGYCNPGCPVFALRLV